MPLDTNIILGAKPAQIDFSQFSPVNTLASAMKLKQLEQEGEINALTLKERKGLQDYLSTNPDLASSEARMNLATRYGESGRKLSEGVVNIDKAKTEQLKQMGEKAKLVGNMVAGVNDDIGWQRVRPRLQQLDPTQQLPETYDPKYIAETMQEALGVEKALEKHFVSQDLGGTTRVVAMPKYGAGPASVVAGSAAGKTMTPAEAVRIKQEGARIGLEGRRVVVLEEEAKQKKDPAFQQQMAQAKATGEAIAKGNVAAQQALPGILSNATLAVNTIDDMIGKQEVKDASGKVIQAATKPHKGFQNAVGATWLPGARFVPGTAASDFQALQDQVEGSAFLSAFEALKGGGAISEKEGAKATAAKLRMKLSQSEGEYIKAAREFQDIVRQGVENAQSKAGAGGTIQAPGGAPAGGGAGPTVSNW
jgi:hypothetical protein